jgi:methionyl-tRNA synthetase
METGIDPDIWRFYIFYNRPEKADTLFAWKDFQEKVNGELIGNLGNLVNRTLSFVVRYYNGKIPGTGLLAPGGIRLGENTAFWERVRRFEADIAEKLDRADLRDAFRALFELSSFANKSFQDGEPWRRRKGENGDPEGPAAAEALIRDLCHVIRDIALLIEPFLPQTAERIASFFGLGIGPGIGSGIGTRKKGFLTAGIKLPALKTPEATWEDLGRDRGLHEVTKLEVLFAKLEDERIDELRERYSGSQRERLAAQEAASEAAALKAAAAFAELPGEFVKKVDLRVAEIVKIERHPRADKLYIETLDIAGEERTIVSGLVPFYREEELLHKRIILAYNLKAAKLRGVESRGMLLAASDKDAGGNERVEALDAGDLPTGTRIGVEGLELPDPPGEIDLDGFFAAPILVSAHRVTVGGKALTAGGVPLATRTIAEGEVH